MKGGGEMATRRPKVDETSKVSASSKSLGGTVAYSLDNWKRDAGQIIPLSLAMKLGSIAVHAEEFLSPDGHEFDKAALDTLLQDPEVKDWIKVMGPMLPRKRS
jgi:hypothetical protein